MSFTMGKAKNSQKYQKANSNKTELQANNRVLNQSLIVADLGVSGIIVCKNIIALKRTFYFLVLKYC